MKRGQILPRASHNTLAAAFIAILLAASPQGARASVDIYPGPRATELVGAKDVRVTVDGQPSFTYDLVHKDMVWHRIPVIASQISSFDLTGGGAEVAVHYRGPSVNKAWVRRLGSDVPARVDGNVLRFRVDRPGTYHVEASTDLNNRGPLVIFANPPLPWKAHEGDIIFRSGTINDIGVLQLRRPGQRIYIPGGAIVRGIIKVETHGVVLAGNGILLYDDTVARDPKNKVLDDYSPLLATDADDLSIRGLTIAVAPRHFERAEGDSPTAPWAVHILRSSRVSLQDVKIFNSVRDGLDIDGSDHVSVRGGYVQSLDDSLCIKSINYGKDGGGRGRSVTDVTFSDIMVMNTGAARALMIGTELHANEIAHIAYRNIDILHALPPRGVAISIANGDRAVVHDVRYEDIRLLDRPGRLINLTVEVDGYKPDPERGVIRDITLRRLSLPAEEATSLIRGMPGHPIADVKFDQLKVGGKSAYRLSNLLVEYAHAPRFY